MIDSFVPPLISVRKLRKKNEKYWNFELEVSFKSLDLKHFESYLFGKKINFQRFPEDSKKKVKA